MPQKKVSLACEVCGSRNYTTNVKKDHTKRLEIKKYCKNCNKSTIHKETF
ncbi:50S ribosomal protein L33 [Apilactobacillus micheneri]|uniref:Large ribosomal subunit protein bL33 n=1 Tax=Apilactobacillus micheneri TaxID=1899430 RepID=A0A2S2JL39_9LACO|nr:50S ribosomal protein L33 [Apilactobacillus micheneri]TPR24205.1 50S ribosomal protein L33 [Apilactobacillus micheneri]TPR25224.1 50S ribosomal protein L33 [Apilactobacillus micheneri]TPR27536.1 50S ribosomal protein L33 [Apilactobacillus micheneri]TPR28801.1 50S ribosomal protein L33 [Apilactobacillus micheneri]TPR29823.1 50S ribosomal protein L33 [Apilactobacillus micheneri]